MKITDVKEGDKLIADAGFTCMKDGQVGEVFRTEGGDLAIPCADGSHTLDGQANDDGELIGLDKAP